jgi:hypothetical protein
VGGVPSAVRRAAGLFYRAKRESEFVTDFDASSWAAFGALLISFLSALAALQTRTQAKRQADAVLGDVPPSFSVYQVDAKDFSYSVKVEVEIVNHNRRALLLRRLEFVYPDNVLVVADKSELRDLIREVLKAAAEKSRSYSWEIPLRLRGCAMNSEPESLTIPFRCSWKQIAKPSAFNFYIKAEYSIDGNKDIEVGFGAAAIVPPKQYEEPPLATAQVSADTWPHGAGH